MVTKYHTCIKKCSAALAYFVQSHTKEIACHCEKKWTFLALFSFLPATASKLSPYFVGQNIILLTKWLFTKKKKKSVRRQLFSPTFFSFFFCLLTFVVVWQVCTYKNTNITRYVLCFHSLFYLWTFSFVLYLFLWSESTFNQNSEI